MKNNQKWNRAISVYEMIGGILGLGITILLILNLLPQLLNQEVPAFNKIFLTIIIVYALGGYLLSFVAGLFLWKNLDKGILLSIIAQAIQIPKVAIVGFSYFFVSGIELFLTISSFSAGFTTYFGSHWNITLYPNNGTFLIGVNIVATIVLISLIKEYKKNKKDK
jgi:hypothetical protein